MSEDSIRHLRAQMADNVDNWSEWTTTSWPVISAALSDPEPGSGVQPLSATLILDSERDSPWIARPPTWL
jgi:hypothetical protein